MRYEINLETWSIIPSIHIYFAVLKTYPKKCLIQSYNIVQFITGAIICSKKMCNVFNFEKAVLRNDLFLGIYVILFYVLNGIKGYSNKILAV